MGEDRTEWFDPKEVNEEQAARIKECREAFKSFYRVLQMNIGESRRQAIVWSLLEQAQMMVTKAITHG